jgi:hypothetical protein
LEFRSTDILTLVTVVADAMAERGTLTRKQCLSRKQRRKPSQKPPGPRLSDSNRRQGHHDFPELMESLESMMVS